MRPRPANQCALGASCYIALGVMSTPDNIVRRDIARASWVENALQSGVLVRFLIRHLQLPRTTQERLKAEHRRHRDILSLPVSAKYHRLRGRLYSLHSWLRLASSVCPTCQWVCKADDDTAVLTADFVKALRLVNSRLGSGDAANIFVGHYSWHTWNTKEFMHHSFYGTYTSRTQAESRRAIEHFAGGGPRHRHRSSSTVGAQASTEKEKLQRALERCTPGGPLTGCAWCPTAAECSGPFPFAVGWLFALSARLATELVTSEQLTSDLRRLSHVNRSWGPPALEDVWLGSLLHRRFCRAGDIGGGNAAQGRTPALTYVSLASAYVFNGGWHTGRGLEFNTTFIFHNKHELPLIHAHARATHAPARPALQCADDDQSDSGGSARRLQRRTRRRDGLSRDRGSATSGGIQSTMYARAEARQHRHYARDSGCGGARLATTWCSLIEPRYLRPPAMRFHEASLRINRVSRPLSPAEASAVDQYHRTVTQARLAFRAELQASGMGDSELARTDYLNV